MDLPDSPILGTEITFATLAENVACDEVLLDHVERTGGPGILRFWEIGSPGVVVGRASRVAQEVDLQACDRDRIPVVRRVSGGCSVMCGPGCLMYALILPRATHTDAGLPAAIHAGVLDRMVEALTTSDIPVQRCGTSDLAWGARKISGNSLRLLRRSVLYHGTVLYHFDLTLLPNYLKMPPREPSYRGGRTHEAFLINLPYQPQQLKDRIRQAWNCQEHVQIPCERDVAELIARRYSQDTWNRQL